MEYRFLDNLDEVNNKSDFYTKVPISLFVIYEKKVNLLWLLCVFEQVTNRPLPILACSKYKRRCVLRRCTEVSPNSYCRKRTWV